MAVTKRTRIYLVQIETSGKAMINVVPEVDLGDGSPIHPAPFENVHATLEASPAFQAAAKALLEAAKAIVDAETVVVTPAVAEVPAVPAVAEIKDETGKVTQAAVAAVPGVPAVAEVRGPRFAGAATL